MKNNFRAFLENKNGLSTYNDTEIATEHNRREIKKDRFPLHVFHPTIKTFIELLKKYYDLPDSFIGLSLLSAFSSAIGTSYAVTSNKKDLFYLSVWGALVGISSSGKTTVINHLYKPHRNIQNEFDRNWKQLTEGLSREKINKERIETIMFRDSHIPTLIRSILPDNPKGIVKYSDELLEWINGMNQLSKREGTDEQFWLSSWSCSEYNATRSDKQKVVINRCFVNVFGGTQPQLLYKFFANNRDISGFTFRILFALPDSHRIAEPDLEFEIPKEYWEPYHTCIKRLYFDLPVADMYEDPKLCVLEPGAVKIYKEWSRRKAAVINAIDDDHDKNIQAGILGKIKEYAMRFSGILHLVDRALNPKYGTEFHTDFRHEEFVSSETMEKAIELAEYFYMSAKKANELVQVNVTAPQEVLVAAAMLRCGKKQSEIAELLYGDRSDKSKMRLSRNLKTWIRDYPRVFQATPK